MKVKSITAFAVLNKKKPRLNVMEIYKDKDIRLGKEEILVKIKIIVI